MVDSYLSIKFGINPLYGAWENALHWRPDRPEDDERPRHGNSSAETVNQS